ncbi:hypothetical protein Elgi_11210 [Paenibacillus elgii]|uniref:hypothetical protein n=1 Tax=Paenibacillus elgii TaxID=189691 RepID=UPI002D7B5C67|nr:hypothetical protein Elgi_11210 [Paenibacillus elgii]
MNRCKLIFMTLLIADIASANTACNQVSSSNPVIIQNETKEQVKQEQFSQEKSVQESDPFLEVVRTAINDELWYHGQDSRFGTFENQVIPVSIYQSAGGSNRLVSFDQPIKFSNNYLAAEFWTTKKGYNHEITTARMAPTKEKLQSIVEKENYKLLKTTQLKMDKASQPEYPAMTPERKKIIEDIELSVEDYLHDNELFPSGTYKYYIRNFRDSESITKVVIEGNQDIWIIKAKVEDSNNAGIMGKLNQVDVSLDSVLYEVNQYKKAAVVTKEVSNM